MPYVRVDIDDFDDDDIIEAVVRRNLEKEILKEFHINTINDSVINDSVISLIQEIYERRRTNQNYDIVLDKLIYLTIGKIL